MGLGCIQLRQEFYWIAVIVGYNVRIFDVEVVATLLDLIDRDFPCEFGLDSLLPIVAAPPVNTPLQVFNPDRLRHRVRLLALWHTMLVVPGFGGRLAPLQK